MANRQVGKRLVLNVDRNCVNPYLNVTVNDLGNFGKGEELPMEMMMKLMFCLVYIFLSRSQPPVATAGQPGRRAACGTWQ